MKSARKSILDLHWPLLFVTLCLASLGVYNLHSAAAAHEPRLYLTQVFWFCLGLGLISVVMAVDYRITETTGYLIYGIVCSLLLAVLLTGKAAMGARRWLVLGPLTFQPSEIAKVATIFCMARYFSHRVEPGGYSMLGLIRPMNPTRPLAVVALMILNWHKPWLEDPIGELARAIRKKLGGQAPPLEDLQWFRAFLLGFLLLSCALTLWGIVRSEQQSALLNPWPEGRRRRLITLSVLLFISLAIGLISAWHAPLIKDPFGVLISTLNRAAAHGGPYATLRPGLALRVVFALFTGAYFLAAVATLRHGFISPIDKIIAPLDILLLPALMVLVQPDLGTAMIILLIGMTIILVVGVQLRSLIILSLMSAFISGIAWFGILKDYQKRRILTFIDPEQDIRGAGWNAVQSLIAVGSGRLYGKGHMNGSQTQLSFLPEQHTDFAFSVWAEEQGFLGCAVVLILYLLLLTLAFAIAADARDAYGVLLATGITALILWQAVINIGMVIGVLPVVGITLPLFSYGGSSVLTVLLGVGLLLNIHWRRRAS